MSRCPVSPGSLRRYSVVGYIPRLLVDELGTGVGKNSLRGNTFSVGEGFGVKEVDMLHTYPGLLESLKTDEINKGYVTD